MSNTKRYDKSAICLLVLLISLATPAFCQTELVPFQDTDSELFGYTNGEGGKVKVKATFEAASPFSEEGFAKVKTEGKFALINKKGKLVSEAAFDQLGWSDDPSPLHPVRFYQDFCGYKSGELWGFMDKKGNILLDPTFSSINYFKDNLAIAGKEQEGKLKFGLIDTEGKIILPIQFDVVDLDTKSGLVSVNNSLGSRINIGLYTSAGKELVPCEFAEIETLPSGLYKVKNQEGFFGLYSKEKGKLQDAVFQEIAAFEEGKAVVKYNYRNGLIDTEGKVLLDFKHKKITKNEGHYTATPFPLFQLSNASGEIKTDFYYDSVACKGYDTYQFFIETKFGLTNAENSIRFFNTYDSLGEFTNGAAVVRKENKEGLIDSLGQELIPLSYKAIQFESSGLIRCISFANKHDLFDFEGKNLTEGKFDAISPFSEGLYCMDNYGAMRFYDQNLQPVFKEAYQNISPFVNGFSAVKKDGYYGIINRNEETVISPYIDSLIVINELYFVFYDNEEWGTISTRGVELAHLSTSVSFERMKDGCLKLKEGKKYGMLNRYGSQILPIAYDSISSISEDRMARIYQNGRMSYMDTEAHDIPTGNELDNLEIVGSHAEKYFPVKMYGTFGFVDYLGRLRVTARYDSVSQFSQGFCGIKLGGKWGYMNKLEKIVIQPKYQTISPFDSIGHAMVTNREGMGVIDRQENFVLNIGYDRIEKNEYGRFMVWQNDKPGIIDISTMENILPLYDSIVDCGNGLVIVERKGRFGLSKINGETIVYPEHDKISYNPLANTYFLINKSSSYQYP
ncbi:WG repeat-containing protein [Flammeovirgaceae bacterium SG7u.111]|nr:WG repeat-containing protein [Flammeovirgaceae bacterium SG7u.132]WPO34095.1 WG repeat-containing protein [Flammeovirgaceae bacterium SG7u.111]